MKNRIAIRGRRKELRKAIRERRSVVKLAEYIDEEFVEDGKVTVRVKVDELYRPMSMGNLRQLNPDIFEYVELFYNRKRMHSYLGYMSPVEYRLAHSG